MEIPPVTMKGSMVMVATMAFGRRWRNMILASETPSARADSTYSKLRARRNSARTTPTSAVHEKRATNVTMIQKFGAITDETIMMM